MTLAEPRQTASCGVGFQAPGHKSAGVDNGHRPVGPVVSQHFCRPVYQHKHRVAVAPTHRQIVKVVVNDVDVGGGLGLVEQWHELQITDCRRRKQPRLDRGAQVLNHRHAARQVDAALKQWQSGHDGTESMPGHLFFQARREVFQRQIRRSAKEARPQLLHVRFQPTRQRLREAAMLGEHHQLLRSTAVQLGGDVDVRHD